MTRLNFIALAPFALMLAGCGTFPGTPEILIQNVKGGGMFAEKDVYEVKKPITEVTEVFKKKAPECLKQTITSSWWERGMKRVQVLVYTPKVIVGKQRTRLTLQMKNESSIAVGDPPPEGWYYMVVDAYPVGSNATRVESYVQSNQKGPFTAVKLWATGKSMGCPDLTQ